MVEEVKVDPYATVKQNRLVGCRTSGDRYKVHWTLRVPRVDISPCVLMELCADSGNNHLAASAKRMKIEERLWDVCARRAVIFERSTKGIESPEPGNGEVGLTCQLVSGGSPESVIL